MQAMQESLFKSLCRAGVGKGKSVKFDFYIQIHSLSPWPAHLSYMTVTWQRGTSHKGQTKAVGPTKNNSMNAMYVFDEGFHLPCTLMQVSVESRRAVSVCSWWMASGLQVPFKRMVVSV